MLGVDFLKLAKVNTKSGRGHRKEDVLNVGASRDLEAINRAPRPP